MMEGAHPRLRQDQGTVLVLVMMFVAVVGLLTVALLQQTGTSLVATDTAAEHEARVSAINAGIDVSIQALREDDANCVLAMPTVTVNDVEVQVACTSTPGGDFVLTATTAPGSEKEIVAVVTATTADNGGDRTVFVRSWSTTAS